MRKPEGQVAGLEALAVAAAQQPQVDAVRHDGRQALGQHGVIVFVAVVQQLDGQAIVGPVQRAGSRRDAQRYSTFIADGKLHQHMGQFGFRHFQRAQVGAFARHAQPAKHGQLHGQGADRDQNDGESGRQGIAEHSDGQAPVVPLTAARFWAFPAVPAGRRQLPLTRPY